MLARILAAGLAFVVGPAAAQRGETVFAPSGAWTVATVHRAHAPGEVPALLVGLHGYGMDERQMRTLVNVRPAFGHVYVALRGSYRPPEGGYGWFAVALEGERLIFERAVVERNVDTVADLLPTLARRFGADPDRIHVVGYSQGGTLALHMALRRPETAASYVAFAGALLPGEWSAPPRSDPTPVLLGHGTLDPLITAEDVEATTARLEALGRRVTVSTHPAPHVVSRSGREAITTWLERIEPHQTED